MNNSLIASLISLLEGISSDCQLMISRLNKGEPAGLGGRLQNIWEVFLLLGQLEDKGEWFNGGRNF